jgi:protein-L-isoaspartate(D-aspartate) O-methyltransferase
MKLIIVCTIFAVLALPLNLFSGTAEDALVFKTNRQIMVAQQIRARGISDPKVLSAMEQVRRHVFVPEDVRSQSYADHPLPIGEGQTISQPYIVALMTESLGLTGQEKVLEIGTGSGYQAAILSKIVESVTTVEIKRKLFDQSLRLLKKYGYENISSHYGDGYYGWPQQAPYDCIMITAAVDHIPPPLIQQLKEGGRLILPLGNPFSYQHLVLVTKLAGSYTVRQITGVLFVPMTGRALSVKEE